MTPEAKQTLERLCENAGKEHLLKDILFAIDVVEKKKGISTRGIDGGLRKLLDLAKADAADRKVVLDLIAAFPK